LNPDGTLRRVGIGADGKPHRFLTPGPDGLPALVELDEDGDGRIERIERLQNGAATAIEIDGDRDGRIDRWQDWSSGRLTLESLDTDGDGVPDRRLRYGRDGQVEALEPVS
jgi:hypothetical protein